MHSTALSAYIWENNHNLNPSPDISWEIICTAKPYTAGQGECQGLKGFKLMRKLERMVLTRERILAKLVVIKQDTSWPAKLHTA